MTIAHAWRWCAAAGVAMVVCAWGFGRIPGMTACGVAHGPIDALGPVLAFEFVRSPADVLALFGAEPCRSTFVAAQKWGLLLDALGFIPAYTALLIFATIACSPAKAGVQLRAARDRASAFAGERTIPVVTIGCLAIAGLCDQIEGVLLYRILTDLPGSAALIDALWWPAHLKIVLLAAGTLGVAFGLFSGRRIAGIGAGTVVGVGAITAVAGLLSGPSPAMASGFAIAWITILLCALAGSWRASLFSATPIA